MACRCSGSKVARAVQALLAIAIGFLALGGGSWSIVANSPPTIALMIVAGLAYVYAMAHLLCECMPNCCIVVLDRVIAALILLVGSFFISVKQDYWECEYVKGYFFDCDDVENNTLLCYMFFAVILETIAFCVTSTRCFRAYARAHAPAEPARATQADGTYARLEEGQEA